MISMLKTIKECQSVPDRFKGIVVGVDISKGKIDFSACTPGEQSPIFTVKQNKAGFEALLRSVNELQMQGYEPWIAFEPTGPYSICFREWMFASPYRVVQVNPYHVKRTKEVRDNSPAKTDLKDPRVIADLVWQGCYQELGQLSGNYSELRVASWEWASIVKKKTAIKNEIQSLIEVWFPEMREVFKNPLCLSARGILRKYNSPTSISASRISSIRGTLRKASKGRTMGRAEGLKEAATRTIAPHTGQSARRAAMVNLLDVLELLEKRQAKLKDEMAHVLCGMSDALCIMSMPRIGTIITAGVLGECGNISRYRTYAQLEKFIGLNLYEVSSGLHKGAHHITKRGRALARYLLCYSAISQCRKDGLFYDYAKELKEKGKKTGQIRVAIARKLLALIYAVARERVKFDLNRFRTGARAEDGPAIQQGTQAKAAA
jgi:transposase